MGHDKLRKFAENEGFACLLQPDVRPLLKNGYANLADHPLKGHWAERFGSGKGLVLELGCGKGEYSIALALSVPDYNYIGVDIKGARLWKGAKYVNENGLGNVAFLRTRIEFITAFFAPGEVDSIWLTFSDPQMKSPNSRLTSPVFLERYRRFLREGGTIHLKTDSRFLYRYTQALCAANSLNVTCSSDDLYAQKPEGFPPELFEVRTFYETMALKQGFTIKYISFCLSGDSPLKAPGSPSEPLQGGLELLPQALEQVKNGIFDEKYWRGIEEPRHFFG
ncbi:MAG: tRNA (guanosine(46)-N7)-methyltransferase TrmB [Bacteroidales bacterium]|nr:tRNA (guanosine(46)-N7)-methyltransferase TrmB [Bacteroidales bacterium]